MSSGPYLWVRWEKQSVPALGFNMHVRRRLCAGLYECMHLGAHPDIWVGCFERVTQPQNECERVWICSGLLGSTSWKSCGWMGPCVHWWMGLRMRVILISRLLWLTTSSTSEPSLHTYRIPMYTPSPSWTRTHRHAHALQHLPKTEARGREVRGVTELGWKTKRRNERQRNVPWRVCAIAVYSLR